MEARPSRGRLDSHSQCVQGHWQRARQGLLPQLLWQLLNHLLICHLLGMGLSSWVQLCCCCINTWQVINTNNAHCYTAHTSQASLLLQCFGYCHCRLRRARETCIQHMLCVCLFAGHRDRQAMSHKLLHFAKYGRLSVRTHAEALTPTDSDSPAQLSKDRRRAPGAVGLGAVGGLSLVKGAGLATEASVLPPKACCIA